MRFKQLADVRLVAVLDERDLRESRSRRARVARVILTWARWARVAVVDVGKARVELFHRRQRLKHAARANNVDYAPRVAAMVSSSAFGARALETLDDHRLASFRRERRRVARHVIARHGIFTVPPARLYEGEHRHEQARARLATPRGRMVFEAHTPG